MPLFLDDTFRSHMFPYPLMDEANGNDAAVGTGTSSMSRINALAHPLLVGRQPAPPDGSAAAASSRNRGGRQRGYRYLQTSARVPNPPAILQRLLGPSATHDVLQLNGGQVRMHFFSSSSFCFCVLFEGFILLLNSLSNHVSI